MDTPPRPSQFTPEAQGQLVTVGRSLAAILKEYYKDPKHRKAFELWYFQKYGTPYTSKEESEQ